MQNTILEDISAEIGYTATTLLCGWFGGQVVYVPAFIDEEHLLCKIIGMPAYSRLVAAFPGQRVFFPRDTRTEIHNRRRVFALLTNGLSANKAGEVLGISHAQVHNIRKELEHAGILPVILRRRQHDIPASDEGNLDAG